ncbi:MAG: alpha-amylase family protein [Bdellovibrionaceae bacterium]|nr:alpha-amylase family protein [Pseudobdellovibrionaceae bacterium]
MSRVSAVVICLLILASSWRTEAGGPRTVFVQLFEWPWADVAKECEAVLGPAGFSAAQVSPPQEHLNLPGSPWWTRYQPISYQLISRAGNEAQFKNMVSRCKAVGVDIYADTVINHMAGVARGVGFSGTAFSHYQYPSLYSDWDFHHCGRNGNDDIANYGDLYEVQNCELVNLADLKTESTYVQQKILDYMTSLLKMGVSGFRIDAAKHIRARDIAAIVSRLPAPAYVYQELILGYNDIIRYSDYVGSGDVTDYVYPFFVAQAFLNQKLGALARVSVGPIASSDAIVFVTNHDLERSTETGILSFHSNKALYRLAQVFMLTWPYGNPQVYSGYNFKDFDQGPPVDNNKFTVPILDSSGKCNKAWTCEHRRPEVLNLVRFRNRTDSHFRVNHYWTNDTDRIAFGRGDTGFVIINSSSTKMTETLEHGLAPGSYCNLLDPSYEPEAKHCANPIQIGQGGRSTFIVPALSAMVLLSEP